MSKKLTVTSPKRRFAATRCRVSAAPGLGGAVLAVLIGLAGGWNAGGAGGRADAQAADGRPDPALTGITFARVDGRELKLDFYPPKGPEPDADALPPLIVWVHGGAWRRGSRDNVPILGLSERGYAIASVDYRLSPVAKFPAQVLDIKSAIYFLRRRAERFGFDRNKIVIAGASAGGHLAALVGVTCGVKSLEPPDAKPVRLAGIVSFYGASNLRTILSQSTPHGMSVRVPALDLLLGGQPKDLPALAALASPVEHVTADDPPILLIHGDADPQMPFQQSKELDYVYRQANLAHNFSPVTGGKHGGEEFYTRESLETIDWHLKDFWERVGDAATITPRR